MRANCLHAAAADMDFYDETTPIIPRPRPMKLLVLGLPRTGTTSMCAALAILGLRSYHWDEVLKHKNNGHFQLWLQAMHAKFDGRGNPPTADDFDRMLWDYDSVSDEPCCFFVQELVAAYPDAKVVLTTRTRQSWLRSMQNSVLHVLSWRSFTLLSYLDHDFTAGYWSLLNRTTSVLSQGVPAYKSSAYPALLDSFDKHYRHVRAVVPRERLLEFHPSQGWEPLCKFLGMAVPEAEFPHLNEPSSLVQIRRDMYWSRWYVVAQRLAKRLGMLSLALLAAMCMARVQLPW